jgi:hypothetical protein
VLSSGCYVGMENGDPRDRRPVPLPDRWPYDCVRERLWKECLDTGRRASEGFDRRMVVAEPSRRVPRETAPMKRARLRPRSSRAASVSTTVKPSARAFSVVSRPPLKSEDRRGPSCGNWIPCAAATIACEGYFLPSCSIRYRRDASNPYLRRNPGSPSSSASVITASTAERSVRSRSAIGLESMPQRAGRPTRWCSGGPGWSGAVGCSCSCSRCAATAGASANARTASGTSSTAMPARHETSDRRALPSPGATSPRQIG